MQEEIVTKQIEMTPVEISAVLIANPTSGSYILHQHQIHDTVQYLRRQGWQAELRLTQEAGDARRIAREAVEQNASVVIAIGGDGTINEIIQELAGSETALGVLPTGTVNVWAREMLIPLDNAGARDVLVNGQTKRIDLGKMNDRYFLLMVGVGLDGDVTHAVERKPVKRLGVLAYAVVAAFVSLHYRPFRASIQLGENTFNINALQIIVGNTQLYAGALKYTWQAQCDDGQLDLCIIRKRGIFGRIMVLFDFLLRRPKRSQWVRYETAQTITIHTPRQVGIQIDGDHMGYTDSNSTPTTISVAPKTLKVIVPRHTNEALFSN